MGISVWSTGLIGLPELLQSPLFDAGYIGPGDPAQRGDLPLGQRLTVIQAVAQANDLGLPGGQARLHAAADLTAGIPQIQLLQHIVVHADHVHQGQGAALPLLIQAV